jgi:hypothetical protein
MDVADNFLELPVVSHKAIEAFLLPEGSGSSDQLVGAMSRD